MAKPVCFLVCLLCLVNYVEAKTCYTGEVCRLKCCGITLSCKASCIGDYCTSHSYCGGDCCTKSKYISSYSTCQRCANPTERIPPTTTALQVKYCTNGNSCNLKCCGVTKYCKSSCNGEYCLSDSDCGGNCCVESSFSPSVSFCGVCQKSTGIDYRLTTVQPRLPERSCAVACTQKCCGRRRTCQRSCIGESCSSHSDCDGVCCMSSSRWGLVCQVCPRPSYDVTTQPPIACSRSCPSHCCVSGWCTESCLRSSQGEPAAGYRLGVGAWFAIICPPVAVVFILILYFCCCYDAEKYKPRTMKLPSRQVVYTTDANGRSRAIIESL